MEQTSFFSRFFLSSENLDFCHQSVHSDGKLMSFELRGEVFTFSMTFWLFVFREEVFTTSVSNEATEHNIFSGEFADNFLANTLTLVCLSTNTELSWNAWDWWSILFPIMSSAGRRTKSGHSSRLIKGCSSVKINL